MAMNNFKRLQEGEERLHPPPPEIEDNLFSNLHILKLLGETVELYVPRVGELFISLLGGSIKSSSRQEFSASQDSSNLAKKDEDIPPGKGKGTWNNFQDELD